MGVYEDIPTKEYIIIIMHVGLGLHVWYNRKHMYNKCMQGQIC